jgi:hypothetical protein
MDGTSLIITGSSPEVPNSYFSNKRNVAFMRALIGMEPGAT